MIGALPVGRSRIESNGTVNDKGEIVRGKNQVTISKLELQQALVERSRQYPEAEGLRQRSIIPISSCMSLKFAEYIAKGPTLAIEFVPPFVAAAAERGQFGYSVTASPVGSDFLAHALRIGSCVSEDGKVLRQPTLGDLDRPGPEAFSNPALSRNIRSNPNSNRYLMGLDFILWYSRIDVTGYAASYSFIAHSRHRRRDKGC